ncbi:hypothetical protein JX266_007097 [Neoarthrinium moseri]|nr:hypothetical protein JX266_007097 [Neoarthrinium moseri]
MKRITVTESNDSVWNGPQDPRKPANWSFARKWTIVVTTSLATFIVSLGSSIFSAAIPFVQAEFGVSSHVALLGISLYVLGFAFGPMVWGPASELYGKTRPLWIGYFFFCLLHIPCALATQISVVLVFRFLIGLAGSSMLAILGGMYVDFLLHPTERGISTAVFSAATFSGPSLGPIVGNIVATRWGWRFTIWATMVGAAVFGMLAFLSTPETSEVVIARRKARKVYKDTGNESILRQLPDETPNTSIFCQVYLTKPIRMICQEPIVSINFQKSRPCIWEIVLTPHYS